MKKTITFVSTRAAMMLLATLLFTLTAQTAWAAGDIYVGYLDPTAPIGQQRKTVLNPVWVDGNTTEMGTADETTWYLVSGTVTNEDYRIEVKGTVNLILEDGCNFIASKGLHVPSGSALNIYAQSVANRGSLTADNYALTNYAAIGGNGGEDAWGATANKGENAGDITIYGGTITTTNGNIGGGDGGNGNAWMDDGNEYSNYYAGYGGNGGNGYVTIYSGNVWVRGNIGGGKAGTGQDENGGNDESYNGYNGGGTVNLSWANASDGIYAENYYGSVTLQKAFYGFDAGVVNDNDLLIGQNLKYAGNSYTVTIGSMPDGVTATADLVLDGGVKNAVEGQVVTIGFSGVPDGKVPVVSVTYGANNDHVNDIIDNGDGTFSFVMPSGTATVTATVIEKIPYILEDGTTAYCTNYTVLDNTMTTLTPGWYVVNSDVTFSGDLSTDASGEVHIILCDGATLTANNITPIGHSDYLRIYGQSQGTGTANISGYILASSSLQIYGGNINATGDIICVQGSIGIFGGTVTAAEINGFRGLNFTGGTITAGTLQVDENGSIILGGATVKANSYSANNGVTIATGITYYDGEGHGYNAGDLSADEIAAIAGKTLTPAIPYVKNGTTAYCTDFTVLDNTMTTLAAGTYVVNSDVTYTGQITLGDDVNIILCDGKTMTASGNSHGIYGDGPLTIYGQALGTGILTATSTSDVGIRVVDGVTINGGTVNTPGICSDGNVTINGGKVTSTGDPGICSNSGTIILGLRNATDYITAESYSGTVKVADGQTLYNGTDGLSGTITDMSKLNGKTLRTYEYQTVSYVKADGTKGSADAIPLTSGGATTLAGGWYVAQGTVNYTGKITLSGDVNLILANNAVVNIGTTSQRISDDYCIWGDIENNLTIYSESTEGDNVGELKAYNSSDFNNAVYVKSYTQYGGKVTIDDTGSYALICRNGDLTLARGTLNATSNFEGGAAIYLVNGTANVNGGTLNATANGESSIAIIGDLTFSGGILNATGNSYGISGDVILGWTNATDQIYASSYNGTVTIAAGKAMTDGSDIYIGPLNSTEIVNKTLTPLTAVGLAFDDDNTETIQKLNGVEDIDITLHGLTFYHDGDWNTLCLPFAVSNFAGTPLEGGIVKELQTTSNLDNGTLTLNFSTVTSIEAGKPYIVKWESGPEADNPVFSGVTIDKTNRDVAFTGGTFKGNYAPLEITDANRNDILLLAAGNKLGYAKTDRTIANGKALRSCHAYFEIPANGGSQAVRLYELDFGDDSERNTTSLSEELRVKSEEFATIPVYDLQGRRVENPTKGLYIVNGKKVVIK